MAVGEMLRSPAYGREKPGDTAFPIFQEYNIYNAEADALGWYDYVADHGLKKGHHGGLDIGLPRGTRLFALNPGRVEWAGFSDYFSPRPIVIRTSDNPITEINEAGYVEIYGHASANTVKQGDTVKPGQQIGFSGEQTLPGTETPDKSGEHLHFELGKLPNLNTPIGPAASGTPYILKNPRTWLTQTGDPDSTPVPPGTPEPSSPGTSFDPSAILAAFADFLRRFLFIIIGVIVIGLGLWTVTRPERFTPIGRVKDAILR